MKKTDWGGVFQRIFDISLPQEHVSSANSPQHPLKRGDTLPADDSSYKSKTEGKLCSCATNDQIKKEYIVLHIF